MTTRHVCGLIKGHAMVVLLMIEKKFKKSFEFPTLLLINDFN